MTVPHEYRAWIPKNPHDSWSESHYTAWMKAAPLTALLEQHAKMPQGNRGVKVYQRPVVMGERAKDFVIP